MSSLLRIFYLTTLLLVVSLSTTSAEEKARSISMDFDNADIRVVIKFISELTGKNIIIDNAVKGKVTVISPSKITAAEAYKVFQSILEVNNFSAIEAGGVVKVVPKPKASKSLSLTKVGKESRSVARDDRIVTQIIPLDYARSSQVKATLAPLISKNGIIVDYPTTNTLIITDISSNIYRLVKIIHEIDMENIIESVEVLPITFAEVKTLSKQLLQIFPIRKSTTAKKGRAQGAGSVLKIIPYERTNSLIVVANDDELRRIKELILELDARTDIEGGEIHVLYLRNAVAEELAKVLNGAISSKRRSPAKGKVGEEALPIRGNMIITPDKSTNSLIITASSRDFRVIMEVIEKLDVRRKQVYVEVTIMEISLDKQRELGLEFRGTSDPASSGGLQVIGGTTFGGIEQAAANPMGLTGSGLVVSAVDGTIPGTDLLNIGVLLRALETESGVNVLSTPHLLTTDNEEAEIMIGENVPFVTSRGATSSGELLETIERRDVGIKLKLTPQINESEFVKLKIFQEISNVKEATTKATDLITTKRSARTTIIIKNRQTVAIGGLIRDNEYKITKKVPLLGDIPLLGFLFRHTKKVKEKTNLVIFITPYIILENEQLVSLTQKIDSGTQKIEPKLIKSYKEEIGTNDESVSMSDDKEVEPVFTFEDE